MQNHNLYICVEIPDVGVVIRSGSINLFAFVLFHFLRDPLLNLDYVGTYLLF